MKIPRSFILACGLLLAASASGEVQVTYGSKATVFTDAALGALPRLELTLDDPHEKKSHRYTGFAARELLTRVGAPLGEKLRGRALQLGVIVRAKDGYAVLFSLAEFDDAFSSRTLLADQIDGQPLPEKSGPLQLIAPVKSGPRVGYDS